MTTLASGSSVAVSLPAGLALYASGGYGTMQVAPPNPGPLVPVTPAGATIGPLPVAVTVNLTATGAGITYRLDNDSVQPDFAQLATDPLTGGILKSDGLPLRNLKKNSYDFYGRTVTKRPRVLPFNLWTPSAWTATNCTIDPIAKTAFKRNSPGATKITPSTASATISHTAGFAANPQDLSAGGCVGMWVYVESATDQNVSSNAYINLVLGNNYARSNAVYFGFAGNHIKSNQWNYLVAHTSETGKWNAQGTGTSGWAVFGTGTFAAPITNLEVNFGNLSGHNIYVDSIEFGLKSRPTIVLGFDGISTASTTALMPLLQERNIKVTMAYNIDVSGVPGNNATVQTWLDYGHEVINHGAHHQSLGSAAANSTVDNETIVGAAAMRSLGFMTTDAEGLYIYPQNATNPFTKARMAATGWIAARGYKGFNVMDTLYGIDGPLEIGAFDIGNPTSLTRLTDLLDMPATYGATGIFFAHDINTTTGQTGPTGNALTIFIDDVTAVLNKIVALRDAGTVDVLTFSQWVDRVGCLR